MDNRASRRSRALLALCRSRHERLSDRLRAHIHDGPEYQTTPIRGRIHWGKTADSSLTIALARRGQTTLVPGEDIAGLQIDFYAAHLEAPTLGRIARCKKLLQYLPSCSCLPAPQPVVRRRARCRFSGKPGCSVSGSLRRTPPLLGRSGSSLVHW